MAQEIKTISPGGVNCYLVKTGASYVLIDTGFSRKRAAIEKELESAGCLPGNLKLIVITHGDGDHADNGAYLREKYVAKIAMHRSESEAVECGDMLLSRKSRPFLARIILPLFRLSKPDRFKPDIYFEDGNDLSEFGFDAKVLLIPGHSMGSIGILTTGDLLTNTDKAVLNSIIDDPAEAKASVEKLKSLKINTVYPGHGQSFPMERLVS